MPMNPDGIAVKGLGTAGIPDTAEVVTVQGIGAGGGLPVITTTPPVSNTAPRPYDSILTNVAAGGIATITFPATPGRQWEIASVVASLIGGSPLAAPFVNVYLQIGGALFIVAGLPAVSGSSWQCINTAVYWMFPVNTAVTVAFSAGNLQAFQSVTAAAYLI